MATEKWLIDAKQLEKQIKEAFEDINPVLMGQMLRWIRKQTKADAVEVVHGWWIELPSMEPDYKCSECGRSYAWWEPSEAHYCPNCGAKMDGDGND